MALTKYDHIEPGMLALFRLACILWLLLIISQGLLWLFGWLDVVAIRLIVEVAACVFLLAYLYSGRLQRQLGRWYLPLGLLAASAAPVILVALDTAWLLFVDGSPDDVFTQWFSALLLLISAIIVGVQYRFRWVLIYTLSIGAVEAAIILPILSYATPSAFLDSVDNVLPFQLVAPDPRNIALGLFLGQLLAFPIIAGAVVGLTGGQKKERRALAQKNIQLTQYAATIERLAISQERNRLARELHDTLAHTLSAVSVQVAALNKQLNRDPNSPANAKETALLLRELTRNGLQESRRALQALRASPLEEMGLTMAMQGLVDAMVERSGMTVTLDMDEGLDDLRPEVEQSVYRITEEALNNANRHARAKRVAVSLRRKGYGLALTVTDDGRGFDLDAVSPAGHYGLVGMQERATLCNGNLVVESKPGTKIMLTIEEL